MAQNRADANAAILVRALKYDGAPHRSWTGILVSQRKPLLVVDARFQEAVDHPVLGTIEKGTISTEYYWLDRWYNVFRFASASTAPTFYCNISLPPLFEQSVLSYVDLDIDVLVHSDSSYEVLDLDDFEQSIKIYSYPNDIQLGARRALDELISVVEKREFPFDQ